jgi:hypothetical protein
MKIFMDRTQCSCWLGACEASFGAKLLKARETGWNFEPGGCIVESIEDGQSEATFQIRDWDGSKLLVLNERNWPDAFDSWKLLCEKQDAQAISRAKGKPRSKGVHIWR